MSRLTWFFFALMFLLCPAVRAQTLTSDLRGIYVYSSDVSQISAAYARSVTAALSLPGTDGIGIAIANTTSAAVSVTFDISDLTGEFVSGISPVTITLPPAGQTAK